MTTIVAGDTYTDVVLVGNKFTVTNSALSTSLVDIYNGHNEIISHQALSASQSKVFGEYNKEYRIKISCLTGSTNYVDGEITNISSTPPSQLGYSLDDRPTASSFGIGTYQVGATLYVSDGVSWSVVGGGTVGGITTGRAVTASVTLALSDAQTRITASHATTPIVLTIPPDITVAWSNEALIIAYQGLAAAVSFAAGAGVTVHALDTSAQYGVLTALRTGANEWTVQK
jgi:hypothetical protein